MAGITANYGFATGLVTDDLIEAADHNRLADSVDLILSRLVGSVLGPAIYSGWTIGADKRVSAGEGIIGVGWCVTTAPQDIGGLTAGIVNYVYGQANAQTGPVGGVQFSARATALTVDGEVYLGTLQLDAGGLVVAFDNAAAGVARNGHALKIRRLSGTGSVASVPAGGEVVVEIDHGGQGQFRVPGALSFTEPSGTLNCQVIEACAADRFSVRVANPGASACSLTYTWTREGFIE